MDFPIKNGDFPVRYVKLPEGSSRNSILCWLAGQFPLQTPNGFFLPVQGWGCNHRIIIMKPSIMVIILCYHHMKPYYETYYHYETILSSYYHGYNHYSFRCCFVECHDKDDHG